MIADASNINDGYLSDVLTQHSAAGSDVSQDLIASTKALESHFKEKYSVLRGAYETRIKKMSEMINTTCCSLLGDELIKEMKQDRASLLFIPAHVNEIIERHLESDRELYIHTLTEKLSQMESSLQHKVHKIEHLQRENATKLKTNEALKHEISSLKESLLESHTKNEELTHLIQQRQVEISHLEQSFHQSARELQLISTLDEEENQLKNQLLAQIATLNSKNKTLAHEKGLLQNRVESLLHEVKILHQEKVDFEAAQKTQKSRVTSLLQQMEKNFEMEVTESNEAISSVFCQMKEMKSRLFEAVHREKNKVLLLTDESHMLQTKLADYELEVKKLKDEHSTLSAQQKSTLSDLQKSQEKNRLLEFELTHEKSTVHQLQTHISQLESQHKSELQKVKFALREEFAQESRLLEQVSQTQKLQMENNILRNSVSHDGHHVNFEGLKAAGGPGGGLQRLSGLPLEQAVEELQLLPEIADIIRRLRHDRDTLLQTQQLTYDSQLVHLVDKHKHDFAAAQQQFDKQKASFVKQLDDKNGMLKEAGTTIGKLKSMVKDSKKALELQKQRCAHLEQQVFSNRLRSPQQSPPPPPPPASANQRLQSPSYQARAREQQKRSLMDISTTERRRQTMDNIQQAKSFTPQRAQSAPRQMQHAQQTMMAQQQHTNSNVSFAADQDQCSQQQDYHQQREGGPSIASSSAFNTHNEQNNLNNTTQTMHSITLNRDARRQQPQQDQGRQRAAAVEMLLRNSSDDNNDLSHGHQQQSRNAVQYPQLQHQVSARPPLSVTSHSQAQHRPQVNTSSNTSDITSSRRQSHNSQQQPPSVISSLPLPSTASSVAASIAASSDGNAIAASTLHHELLVEGPHATNEADNVLTAALHEAQEAHNRNQYLEDIISQLQAKLSRAEQASKYLNRQRKVGLNLSFTETLPLSPSAENKSSTSLQKSTKKASKMQNSEHGNGSDNEDVDNDSSNSDNDSGDDNEEEEQQQQQFDEQKENDDDYTSQHSLNQTIETNDEAPELSSLLHLQSQLHHTLAVNSTWEEKLAHTLQLLDISRQEVQTERQQVHALKLREKRLFELLVSVDKVYRLKIQELKRDMMVIRSAALDCRVFAANEAIMTVNKLKLEFNSIFTNLLNKQERDLQEQRVAMQTAHNHELSILESRFIEQINIQNQKHSKELEKIHSELLTRTERALNASVAQDGFMVTENIDYLPSHQSSLMLLGQSQVMTSSADISRMLSSSYSGQGIGQRSNSGQQMQGGLGLHQQVQQGQGLPAYESVLRGVLQGLQDQDTISTETVSKVTALGKAHQEPSFAANAAARALVGEEIDRFVVDLLQKKYQSGSALTSPVGASAVTKY